MTIRRIPGRRGRRMIVVSGLSAAMVIGTASLALAATGGGQSVPQMAAATTEQVDRVTQVQAAPTVPVVAEIAPATTTPVVSPVAPAPSEVAEATTSEALVVRQDVAAVVAAAPTTAPKRAVIGPPRTKVVQPVAPVAVSVPVAAAPVEAAVPAVAAPAAIAAVPVAPVAPVVVPVVAVVSNAYDKTYSSPAGSVSVSVDPTAGTVSLTDVSPIDTWTSTIKRNDGKVDVVMKSSLGEVRFRISLKGSKLSEDVKVSLTKPPTDDNDDSSDETCDSDDAPDSKECAGSGGDSDDKDDSDNDSDKDDSDGDDKDDSDGDD